MSKILLIDDEPEIIFLTQTILKKEGYNIIVANNGKEGLDILKHEKPDLILLDIMMPDIDGWEVCKKIKEKKETKDIPIIMFTVRTSDDSVEKSINYAKANAHLNKPFKVEELVELIRKFV